MEDPRFEPDRPGRHAGLLQELIGFQFPADNVAGSLADFDYKLAQYEAQSKETIGDVIKTAVLQKGLQDEQLRNHLVLNATRLTTWAEVREEVRVVMSTRMALQGPIPMDISAIDSKGKCKSKKGKESSKGKDTDGKESGKGEAQRSRTRCS